MENVLEGYATCKGTLLGVFSLFPVSCPGTIFHHQECWEELVWIILWILYCCQLRLAGLAGHTALTHFISPACLMVCSHAMDKPAVESIWSMELLDYPHLEWACSPVLALSSNLAVAGTSGCATSGWVSEWQGSLSRRLLEGFWTAPPNQAPICRLCPSQRLREPKEQMVAG